MINIPPCKSFDRQALLAAVGDSEEIMHAVLGAFPAWQNEMNDQLEAARASLEPAALARVAHGLRGTLAQIHATGAASLANEIEFACAQADIDHARLEGLLLRMQAELVQITAEISVLLGGSEPA